MRSAAFLLLFAFSTAFGQIAVHPTLGVKPWFDSWRKESVGLAKKTRIRGDMDKDVVALYLTVVNGKKNDAGGLEGVSRAIFPTGRYSVVAPSLEYAVISAFPNEPTIDAPGLSVDWASLYNSYLYNDSVEKRVWDQFVLRPEKYRVPGLVLTQKRMQELSSFLEKEIKADSAATNIYPSRPVKGESSRLIGGWINLIEPHWGSRWIFRSFPTVHGILIDKGRMQAVVKYGIHNGSGIARYRKEGKRWVLIESRITIMQ